MRWLVELVVGLFKAIFSVSMNNPIEKTDRMIDVGHPVYNSPDDIFSPEDW